MKLSIQIVEYPFNSILRFKTDRKYLIEYSFSTHESAVTEVTQLPNLPVCKLNALKLLYFQLFFSIFNATLNSPSTGFISIDHEIILNLSLSFTGEM